MRRTSPTLCLARAMWSCGSAPLNYHDIFTRRGMPGIKIPMPAIIGLDVAGEIAAIGPGVSGWKMGDRVLGDPINRVEGGLTGETVHGGLAGIAACAHISSSRFPMALGSQKQWHSRAPMARLDG